MDLVTLPHVLELSPNPQQALHEAVRVLEPEGRLILTAFNGAGFWWMRQQTVRLGAKPYLPTDMAPIPLRRLKDWFALLGLEIDRGRFGLYRPGFRSARRLHAWEWLDKPVTDGCRNAQIFFCSPLLSGVPERESSTAANLPIFQLKYRPQACRPPAASRQLSPQPPSHRPHQLRKTIKHHDSSTYTYCS